MKKTLLLSTLLIFSAVITTNAQKIWNFTQWSQATIDNCNADAATWEWVSETRFQNAIVIDAETPLTANGVEIEELQGLTFGNLNAGKFRIDHPVDGVSIGRFILNGSSLSINVPDCKAGDVIRLLAISANSSDERGFTATNATRTGGLELTTELNENVFSVDADGTVVFTTTGGMQVRYLTINAEIPTSVKTITPANLEVVRNVFYNLNGQYVADDFESLPGGIFIKKTFFDNGTSKVTKIAKVQAQ
ncbi:hypothetical protein ACE01N_14805 [Saccharicrinis sp. FJH2]|uniref:hypothetical protein n=1 Tax=Saccharicrinis sp. FJH65 TaxID=3344659 RepID=UPI0035F4371C